VTPAWYRMPIDRRPPARDWQQADAAASNGAKPSPRQPMAAATATRRSRESGARHARRSNCALRSSRESAVSDNACRNGGSGCLVPANKGVNASMPLSTSILARFPRSRANLDIPEHFEYHGTAKPPAPETVSERRRSYAVAACWSFEFCPRERTSRRRPPHQVRGARPASPAKRRQPGRLRSTPATTAG